MYTTLGEPSSPQPITLRVVPDPQPIVLASSQQQTNAGTDIGAGADVDAGAEVNTDGYVDTNMETNANADPSMGITSSLLMDDNPFEESGSLPQLPPTSITNDVEAVDSLPELPSTFADDFVGDSHINYG